MIDDAFELIAKGAQAAIKVVVRKKAEYGDREAARGGDQGLGDAAADFGGGKLLVADEAEGAHDAGDGAQEAQERGEGDEGAEDPLEAFGMFEFIGGAELHGAEQRGVGMKEALVDGGEGAGRGRIG